MPPLEIARKVPAVWCRLFTAPVADLVTENDVEEYLKLKRLVEEVADDVYKAVGGNKAAGTRVRRIMQDVKNTAQDLRKRVLDLREAEEAGAPSSSNASEPS